MNRFCASISPLQTDSGWYFRQYLISVIPIEDIAQSELDQCMAELVSKLEMNMISNEYDYLKFGFAIIHYGRRGICISFWHWGLWSTSYEVFNQSWYTYGRNLTHLEPLDTKEPRFCHYETNIILHELAFIDQHTKLMLPRDLLLENFKLKSLQC